ncbi:hypothetical protein E4T80_04235 [Muribacter muris]|uniref:Lipoprotein n=1 Tax=Muribacter muris TaxID=67855 RepID=A0A4Y9K383_9PAST|nr:hypothetical protein [Muribacter muris]MBF0784687.1 hypothetical protein [Muribacter muris]MBF0827866.1 hypothetical protein [Muribacter muris]TFV11116.1 hypothetical protein E4T80_04235 [Muribacter muris]
MKKHFKLISVLAVSSMLSACANFDLGTILQPQKNQQVTQTIPNGFAGKWVSKKNHRHKHCNPPAGDFLEQPFLIINPKQNHLEWLTWSDYRVIKFHSLSDSFFTAEVEVTSIEIDPDDTPSVSRKNLSAKLVNPTTLVIDDKRYHRCP